MVVERRGTTIIVRGVTVQVVDQAVVVADTTAQEDHVPSDKVTTAEARSVTSVAVAAELAELPPTEKLELAELGKNLPSLDLTFTMRLVVAAVLFMDSNPVDKAEAASAEAGMPEQVQLVQQLVRQTREAEAAAESTAETALVVAAI